MLDPGMFRYLKQHRFHVGRPYKLSLGIKYRGQSFRVSQIRLQSTAPTNLVHSNLAADIIASNSTGISHSYWPYAFIQNAVNGIHCISGAPWWASIILTTIGIRSLMLPLTLRSMKNARALSHIQPRVKKYVDAMKAAKLENDTYAVTQNAYAIQKIYRSNNINPLTVAISPIIQATVFISFFYGLRKMSQASIAGFNSGGLLWFRDLTTYDPYYILPTLNGLLVFLSFRENARFGTSSAASSVHMQTFMQLFCLLTPFITCHVPSSVFLYWIPSTMFTAIQALVTRRLDRAKLSNTKDPVIRQGSFPQQVKEMLKAIKDNFHQSYSKYQQLSYTRSLRDKSAVNLLRNTANQHKNKRKKHS
ncbi:inner membrane translocase Oxa101 [Schizosaccharomyces japonicus yFS275]|uniref:Inner membrane translocase Oxa101 n=1 Tax=Schizosaccharomyces japonicus (strain yFS275 / FY16936) TaxID=402676 RepID=B6K432_SCHJY|nr:inner membrane translocase Oxa101 [Schizosaccharomyces japonicus yFS275]EEB08239.1 inner membrane translocase Oxa101 [Schizosaccharomyces japonicus yFS275]